MNKDYDYIICGAGAAGLSLAYRLADEAFYHLKILIVDKDAKQKDDRTWAVWTEGDGLFDHLAVKTWNNVIFKNSKFEKELPISPYRYIKIRGIDFYNYTLRQIDASPHITFLQDEVVEIVPDKTKSKVRLVNHGEINANWVFSSVLNREIDKTKYNYVDQHFKGWFIKTAENKFNPKVATLMDFNIPQEGECRFMYVLPTSTTEALVEFAIFSNNVLTQEAYDAVIKKYLHEDLKIQSYEIEETEFGVIPMTTFPFENANTDGLTLIGTAGSAAKASTGYAFLQIQDQAKFLVERIRSNLKPTFPKKYHDNKYRWFDNILLNVLLNNRASLGDVFGEMFDKLPAPLMLKFLANKTSFWEELRVLSKPKKLPFIKAALNEMMRTN